MKDNTALGALEILRTDPFLADLIDTINAGEFIAPDQDPVIEEGIEILGKMDDLDKYLYTLAKNCRALYFNSKTEEQNKLILGGKIENATNFLSDRIFERFAEKFSKGGPMSGIVFYSDFSIAISTK